MSDLKPCPFCGGRDVGRKTVINGNLIDNRIWCKECGSTGPVFCPLGGDLTESGWLDVEKEWNTRSGEYANGGPKK